VRRKISKKLKEVESMKKKSITKRDFATILRVQANLDAIQLRLGEFMCEEHLSARVYSGPRLEDEMYIYDALNCMIAGLGDVIKRYNSLKTK
jgi:hypothetical protein